MEKYTILKQNDDLLLVALNSIYDFQNTIETIEKDLVTKRFNGFLVFDYLLSCVSDKAVDRFVGYKVISGKISKNDKYIFLNQKNDLSKIGDDHFMNIDSQIIKSSLLSTKSQVVYLQHKSFK